MTKFKANNNNDNDNNDATLGRLSVIEVTTTNNLEWEQALQTRKSLEVRQALQNNDRILSNSVDINSSQKGVHSHPTYKKALSA